MVSVDISLCRCPACRRRFDAIDGPAKLLFQVKRREIWVCFYCGCFLVAEGLRLRVITYTEFDLLDERIRAELVGKRIAVLDHWRQQPLKAHPKPQCSWVAGNSETAQIRVESSYTAER